MSFILTLRQCLRALTPAFVEPRPSFCRAEPLSTWAEPAAEGLGPWHGADAQGWDVDTGESHYAASRERTIVRALYQGCVGVQ